MGFLAVVKTTGRCRASFYGICTLISKLQGKNKAGAHKNHDLPDSCSPPERWGCCGFNYSFISVLNGHLLCKASLSPEWLDKQRVGLQGGKRRHQGSTKQLHTTITQIGIPLCACVHETDTDGVAGLKSCAAVCRLVSCVCKHMTPSLLY